MLLAKLVDAQSGNLDHPADVVRSYSEPTKPLSKIGPLGFVSAVNGNARLT